MHRRVAPPHGTEIDTMGGVDTMGLSSLLQSMTGGGDRAGEQLEASGLIILV